MPRKLLPCGKWRGTIHGMSPFKVLKLLTIMTAKQWHAPVEDSRFTSTPVTGSQWKRESICYPFWVTNDDLSRVLESRGDIKSVQHVTEKNIITGVREVVFSMREGDQNHLPYLTSVHGHRCLLSIPGRPPNLFLMRGCRPPLHQCRHGDRPGLHSYASAVQGPVVTKRWGGPVGKAPSQAVSKPTGEEPSDSPSNRGTLVVPRRAWLPFLPIVDVVLMYIML